VKPWCPRFSRPLREASPTSTRTGKERNREGRNGEGHDFSRATKHRCPRLQPLRTAEARFVAVANAHRGKPPILQATDSKWWGWKDALRDCGLSVELLCPDEVEATYRKKYDG